MKPVLARLLAVGTLGLAACSPDQSRVNPDGTPRGSESSATDSATMSDPMGTDGVTPGGAQDGNMDMSTGVPMDPNSSVPGEAPPGTPPY